MATYQLAGINFISMSTQDGGPPPHIRTEVQPIIRPGVDGTAFVIDAVRGRPFQMKTFGDFLTDAAAASAVETYQQLIGSGLYQLIWKNNDYTANHNTKFAILDVNAVKQNTFGMSAGGLSGNGNRVGLWCRWDLVPVGV